MRVCQSFRGFFVRVYLIFKYTSKNPQRSSPSKSLITRSLTVGARRLLVNFFIEKIRSYHQNMEMRDSRI